MASFAKYRHAFLIGLQSNLVYRWNFAVRASFSLVHLAYVFILWGAAFAGQTSVAGFDLRQTLTYFIVMLILQFFISAMNEDYEVSEEIRNGLINQFLLKPINYFAYRFSIFAAARLVSGSLALLPILIAAPFLYHYVSLPSAGWTYVAAVPALLMSACIQFTLAYCFGLLTSGSSKSSPSSFSRSPSRPCSAVRSSRSTCCRGGCTRPLRICLLYQMYLPAALLTGRIGTPEEALRGLVIQLFWVFALYGVAQLLWTRGLRRHTAVGG